MPSTHLSLLYHVVFSTKDRVPSIAAAWREDVVRYVKAVSSRWVHEEIGEHSFVWRGGETPPPRVAPFANPSRGRRSIIESGHYRRNTGNS